MEEKEVTYYKSDRYISALPAGCAWIQYALRNHSDGSGYKYHGSGRFSRIGKYPPTRIITFCPVLYKKNGWGFENFVAEADNGIGKPFPQYLRKYMSYVLPLIIVVIYFKGYYDTFAPKGPKLLCI